MDLVRYFAIFLLLQGRGFLTNHQQTPNTVIYVALKKTKNR